MNTSNKSFESELLELLEEYSKEYYDPSLIRFMTWLKDKDSLKEVVSNE